MNTTAIPSKPLPSHPLDGQTGCDVALSFDDALRERELALAAVEANSDQWTRDLIDRAILAVIQERGEAGMNHCRDLLPHIPNRALFGQRMRSLVARKVIVWVRDEPSTEPSTHAKRIGVYRMARP